MTKLTFKVILIFLILASVFASCDDIFEKSLNKKTVTVLAPLDGSSSEIYTQTFWWQEVKGASKYKLQMVKNKFDSLPVFYMDTFVTKNIFKAIISPGSYQWRVYAVNGSSQSNSATIQNLRIDSVNIKGQEMLLTAPINNLLTKNSTVTFKWEQLPGAREYTITIDSASKTIKKDTVTTNEYEYLFKYNGKYSWKVVARNRVAESNVSEKRNFTIDTKAEKVELESPADKDEATAPEVNSVDLKWKKPTDDVVYYMIRIYKNSKTSLYDGYPRSTEKDSPPDKLTYTFTRKAGDTVIFWSIIAVDKAGNQSEESEIREYKFK